MDIKLKFGIISLVVIIFQSILKLYGAILTNSLSFLSETLDTFTDIGFISLTLYSLYQSQKPPDYQHMYGHGKIESIGALIQGVILLNLYGLLIIYAIQAIIEQMYQTSNPVIGIQLLIISILLNLIFSRLLIWQGKRRRSLILKMQGFNLFYDSLRAIIVIMNFIFVIFGIVFLDPLFSIALSIWIIISATKLSRDSVKELSDVNPISYKAIENIRQKIFELDHVNAVEDLRIRASGNELFFEVSLLIEDHISLIHAKEITTAIRTMAKQVFPNYELKSTIEMNPIGGEDSLTENIFNLVSSMIPEFPGIIDVKDFNIIKMEHNNYLSADVIVDETLTLSDAHDLSDNFENTLKNRAPFLHRITTHIESQPRIKKSGKLFFGQMELNSEILQDLKNKIVEILKSYPVVKGYHGLEFFTTFDFCILEIHVFFEGSLNISLVHEYLTEIEQNIKNKIKDINFQEIILHSEPLTGRKDGIIF